MASDVERNCGLKLVPPRVRPPLDPAFRPAVLANAAYRAEAEKDPLWVELGLERADGSISRFRLALIPPGKPGSEGNFFFLERFVKFALWSRGGFRIYLAGAPELAEALRRHYAESATGKFDAWIMGGKIYERPFEVVSVPAAEMPEAKEPALALGGHWEGCRIGFDLGASDRKVAAVKDGELLFSEETPWDPKSFTDPQQHYDGIMDSLKRAAAHLPRVDAIGGSAAGVYVDNRVKVASLFRGAPEELFEKRVKNLFFELKEAWGGVPFEVVNDGEVAALAGATALQDNAVLGVALGSSEAAGYVTPRGTITAWLDELAFAPVDYAPHAPADEWSGDLGCGVQYFSQQAVGRLIPASGLTVDPALPLPEKLVAVQEAMAQGDERAARIYETIGVYLGYALAHYADFYDFRHTLLMGRVTSGRGGAVIAEKAKETLGAEFPELARKIQIHLPDERQKRHGQAMAAASLPALPAAKKED